MPKPSPYTIQSVETLAGVDALAGEWAALESATPEATGFQSFPWCRTWLAVAGDRARPRILCVREQGRLVMLLPFQIEKRLGVAIARWIGEPMTQYGDALALPGDGRPHWRGAAMAEMARWRDVDLFALTRLRAGGVMSDGTVAGEPLSAPYVALAAFKPRRQKSVERRLRKLEAYGPILLDEAESPAKRESLARHALELKRSWLGGKGIYSAGLSNSVSDDFLAALARDGFLRVHALRVGGEIAAMDLGFVGGGAYRSLLGCYEGRFAEGSPGQALTGRLIARCAAEGLSSYDMLLPADSYKLSWATGETPIEARFIATSAKGHAAAFAIARLRPLAKRAVHAAGPAWTRLTSAFSFSRERASLSPTRREERAT
ncbi:GNAT family N-acetyltransferase [Methylocystis parvus]|uniref:GNAT family N-acetyltransferase n=1 Tax=Methylocystis parvus TaxID=134 RepID=A0A6B8M1T7_9HYPH|nr:GNAT family N-acetyltransferase [Methylocystis parvus]QGM98837.1 GNAT family N-acetyltransferase [Methylocystis parvus]WBK00810.1 GNAT family N-acetyltransferase [Methylocystis parvus OBBP]